ncbi:RimK family alpha-L-glutamate ligase [Micromonospora sp. NPDC050397]|uniref:ATP-grasp domain-containing protein n=1 Tax=Micromonospora sp. NPDC050397 TaxID=3364279 RepID=UPI00384C5021
MAGTPLLTMVYRPDDFAPMYLRDATEELLSVSSDAAERAGFRFRILPAGELLPASASRPQLWHQGEDLLQTRQFFQVDDFSWDPQTGHHLKAVRRVVQASDSILLNQSFRGAEHLATDKLAIVQYATRMGLHTPATVAIPFGRYARMVLPLVEQQIGSGPYVVKPREMGMGFGVVRVDGIQPLSSTIDVVGQTGMGYIVQPFLANAGDLRVYVIEGRVIATQHRVPKAGMYLANVSQGATSAPDLRDPEADRLSLQIAESLGAACLQVDWLLTEQGPVLNEWSTGFGGFSALPEPQRTRVSDALFGWARRLY